MGAPHGGRLFGTDGVRGLANGELTAELALGLSVAAAAVLPAQDGAAPHGAEQHSSPERTAGARPTAVVGRDPRASGEFLSAAVVAGLASAGVDVVDVGVVPTPAVAHLTAELGATFGVMLSASHNPMPDNGIKFFARGGQKLADELEDAIAARYAAGEPVEGRPTGAAVGRVRLAPEGLERYVAHVVSAAPHRLDGLRVVVDAAHGAASVAAPEVLRRLGADVVAIGAQPDGLNINDGCGSTHLEPLRAAVLAHGADVGIAHDGDADRCLAVDAEGRDVDGDQILAVLALALRDEGRLAHDTVVATVMANLGFRLALQEQGLEVVETKVGDRYVLEAMRAGGFSLGGEQSGHVVLADSATTGDGVLTAVHLLGRMAATGRPLAELAAVMQRLPQVLLNVSGVDKSRVELDDQVSAAVSAAERELGSTGRVLLRPSGTEPVVRVMVEAPSADQAQGVADRLAGVVRSALALV
ncbi:phosphoglucosamine mutase [Motilibacter peucedani]|uniref:phosphoglucosamine mutase n=1 Tax=Motilibacter peucedani TaxID=598650 RepID=UPI000EAEE386|nr:phosphoglucosamine mutase [Motilibacter peucedani]